MMEMEYDLVLRDEKGGFIQRWIINSSGQPCNGRGRAVSGKELVEDIAEWYLRDVEGRTL